MEEDLPTMLNKFLEHFQCAICMSTLKNTYTTKNCAHRYCEGCIKECINTLHKCPLCNRVLDNENDIVKDAQYDDLVSSIAKLKEKDEESFLKKMVAFETNRDGNNNEAINFSPLENVLRKHLMNVLTTHQNYFNQLRFQYVNEMRILDENAAKKLAAELDRDKREAIKNKLLVDKKSLEDKFNETTEVICKTYDKYLVDNLPKPSVIQAPLRVRILRKDLRYDGLVLKPNDDIRLVFEFIENKVKETLEDKIIEYGDNMIILCFGPFSNYNSKHIEEIYENYLETNTLDEHYQIIKTKNCMPVLEYSVKPGSELVICGNVKFESDLPLQCFSKKFDPHVLKLVDYYSCKTCGLNWICKNCSLVCHEGHEKGPYIIGHKPTWACCYCKKNNCTIRNN